MVRQNECGHAEKKHFAKGMCKQCYRRENYQNNRVEELARVREWGRNNPEKTRAAKWRYQGLPTPTQPEPTVCEICNKLCTENIRLSLDHCHTTGKFRGWLCNKCNRSLGQLGDNLPSIQRVITYLQRNGEADYRADDGVFGDC